MSIMTVQIVLWVSNFLKIVMMRHLFAQIVIDRRIEFVKISA